MGIWVSLLGLEGKFTAKTLQLILLQKKEKKKKRSHFERAA